MRMIGGGDGGDAPKSRRSPEATAASTTGSPPLGLGATPRDAPWRPGMVHAAGGGGKGGTPSPPSCCFRRRDLPRGRSSSGVAPCSDPIPDPCMLLLIQSMQHAAASSIKHEQYVLLQLLHQETRQRCCRRSQQQAGSSAAAAAARRQRQQQQQPAAHLANSQIWRDLDRRQNPKYANQPRNCQCQTELQIRDTLGKNALVCCHCDRTYDDDTSGVLVKLLHKGPQ
eukprot:SAG25_NODE_109_length_15249_cov_11.793201_5_plen_226_part_00